MNHTTIRENRLAGDATLRLTAEPARVDRTGRGKALVNRSTRQTHPGTLVFWISRARVFALPQPAPRHGPAPAPPIGIWRGLVDLNHLVWRK